MEFFQTLFYLSNVSVLILQLPINKKGNQQGICFASPSLCSETHLDTGHVVDLSCQRVGERRRHQVLGSLDAEVDDLSVQLVVLLLQAAVVLERMTNKTHRKSSILNHSSISKQSGQSARMRTTWILRVSQNVRATCLSRLISCSSSASRVRVWYSCSPAPGVRPLFASASSL